MLRMKDFDISSFWLGIIKLHYLAFNPIKNHHYVEDF